MCMCVCVYPVLIIAYLASSSSISAVDTYVQWPGEWGGQCELYENNAILRQAMHRNGS